MVFGCIGKEKGASSWVKGKMLYSMPRLLPVSAPVWQLFKRLYTDVLFVSGCICCSWLYLVFRLVLQLRLQLLQKLHFLSGALVQVCYGGEPVADVVPPEAFFFA